MIQQYTIEYDMIFFSLNLVLLQAHFMAKYEEQSIICYPVELNDCSKSVETVYWSTKK